MHLEACLPAALRGPTTTIARVSAGLSGAGVYRVDAGAAAYVLKVSGDDEPLDRWRRVLHIRRLAADAGLAPRIVHVDEGRRVLAEEPPAGGEPSVLSHNDVNPSNVVYDGERLLFFDWETAGPNDRYYDLATVSPFLRMDEATCLRLLSAHDGEPVTRLPARFLHDRRLVAALCGATVMPLARERGHPGATGSETLDAAPTLGEFYARMQSGAVSIATAEGQWGLGMALVKEGAAL